MNKSNDIYVWDSEVRGYEIDAQNIVNNAIYLQYFDHVRIKQLYSLGIDWSEWHNQGLDLVLIHIDMKIKSSLYPHEEFRITSTIEKISKLKILFTQKILKKPDLNLVAEAKNIVVCVSRKLAKPVFPAELENKLFKI